MTLLYSKNENTAISSNGPPREDLAYSVKMRRHGLTSIFWAVYNIIELI